MSTATVLPVPALPAQPEMVIELCPVLLSAMVASVPLVCEQPGGPLTVSVYDVVWVVTPPTPVIVTWYVPGAVAEVVAMVSADEAPELTEDGLKLAVAPLGRPLAESATVCGLPTVVAVLTVAVTELPGFTEPEV